jgi:osmotically-inducible protein OsmY
MKKLTWVGILGGALVSGAALANQTETLDRAGQEMERAGEATKQGAEETGKATEQGVEKATEEIDRAAEKGKEEVDTQAEKAKREVERTASGDEKTADMESRVEDKLEKDAQLRGSDIDAEADEKGVVTLTGTVPNDSARTRAIQLTSTTKGVKEVTDNLEVFNPAQ